MGFETATNIEWIDDIFGSKPPYGIWNEELHKEK